MRRWTGVEGPLTAVPKQDVRVLAAEGAIMI